MLIIVVIIPSFDRLMDHPGIIRRSHILLAMWFSRWSISGGYTWDTPSDVREKFKPYMALGFEIAAQGKIRHIDSQKGATSLKNKLL
jgi:hypothetical protein